jgi:hypothetical protein
MKKIIVSAISLVFLLLNVNLYADYGDYSDYLKGDEEEEPVSKEDKYKQFIPQVPKEVLTEEEKKLLEEDTSDKEKESEIEGEAEITESDKSEKEKEEKKKPVHKEPAKYVSAMVLANLTVPTGKADATWAVHARLHYILPFWNPYLSFGAEAGYYTLKGKGTNIDPQAGLYDYSWRVDTLPLFIGFAVEYPVIRPVLHFFAEAGFAAVFAWSEGSSFGGKSSAKDVAYGWYGGIGTEIRFGVFGGIVLQGRYTGMLLDFEYPQYNEKPGDIGGISVLLGYRNRF